MKRFNGQSIFHNFPREKKIAPALVTVYDSYNAPKSPFIKVEHPYWALDYALTDLGEYRVGSSKAPWCLRKAKTAHLYSPRTIYWEILRGVEMPIHNIWILFTGGDVAGLDTLTESFTIFEDNKSILEKNLKLIVQAASEKDFWKSQAEFCNLISLLLNSRKKDLNIYSIDSKSSNQNISPFCEEVLDYLRFHIGEHVSLETIAKSIGVSSSTLSHRYREESGVAPLESLMEMRLDLAKTLILKGERLKVIAAATGFTDEFHLSKIFKRKTGLSPRGYLISMQ